MQLVQLFEAKQKLDKHLQFIKDNCSEWVKATDAELTYRGLDSKTAKVHQVRKDRRPRDSAPELHNALDAAFDRRFGIKARSGAVFASGDWIAARGYGTINVIFPIGKFTVVWAPSIHDLYSDLDIKSPARLHMIAAVSKFLTVGENRKISRGVIAIAKQMKLDKALIDELKGLNLANAADVISTIEDKSREFQPHLEELETYAFDCLIKKYTTKNPARAVVNGGEMMVECDSYYAIPIKEIDKLYGDTSSFSSKVKAAVRG